MSSPPNPRALAVRVLRRVEREGAYSNRALAEELEAKSDMDPRDRGLATALVYGVLRHVTRLDRHIDAFAHNPDRLKGELRMILRVACYELREMERPLRVASSEAAKLTSRLDPRGRLRGLVTAILSGIDRGGEALDEQLDAAEPVDALRYRWSIPGWLGRRWVRTLGPEVARARARAMSEEPYIDLRIDASRFDTREIREEIQREHPRARMEEVDPTQAQCIRLRAAGDIFYSPAFERGAISIQSLGAQQAALALAAATRLPGARVLDACAGMGTKTLQLAELMGRRGELVAVDTDARKLEEFDALRERGALDQPELRLQTIHGDLGEALDLGERFDAILLDAPCTGLGDLARHPELRSRVRPEQLRANSAMQARLLRSCAERLRPGGTLVYAVCSLEPEEGVELIRAVAPECGLELLDQAEWTPESHASDGFFHATLRRPQPV